MVKPMGKVLHRFALVTIAGVVVMLFTVWLPDFAWSLGSRRPVSDSTSPIGLTPVVASGLEKPLFLTHAGDESGRLFIVEQPGRIQVVKEGRLLKAPFLDISDRVAFGGERGLLGLAFHPAYRSNGRFIVNYSRAQDGATVVAEYRVSDDPDRSRREEKVLLIVEQPYGNHNGGMVAFGPDGFLYIGMGDGGSGGDPKNYGQNLNTLLGKVLRIDVDHGEPYTVPSDNPYGSGGGRPEIYALGFRNPWRFSFDRETGGLWAADVGQNDWEEIHVVRLGGNYGWRIMEGSHCFSPRRGCHKKGLELPVAEYGHQGSRCSITGGYVYRGKQIPSLRGTYLFGDYCSGEILGLPENQTGSTRTSTDLPVLLSTGHRISSFGEDQAGELYVVDHGGSIHRITRPKATGLQGRGGS